MDTVIFDFNGTMVFDGKYHEQAWKEYVEQLIERELSTEEFQSYILGRINRDIFTHFLSEKPEYRSDRSIFDKDGKIQAEKLLLLSEGKEARYRVLFEADVKNFKLAAGLPEYLNRLKSAGIKLNIASAANQTNIDFYFEKFHLDNWFDKAAVAYDDGTVRGKPAPDLYQRAMENIGAKPENTMVYEDGRSGVLAAHAAGITKIVGIYGDSNRRLLEYTGLCSSYFKDYTEVKSYVKKGFQ